MSDTLYFSNTKGTAPIRLDKPVTISIVKEGIYPTEPTEALSVTLYLYLVATYSAVPYRITCTSQHMTGSIDYVPDAETAGGAFIGIPLVADATWRMQSITDVQITVTSADGRAEPRNLYIGIPGIGYAYNVRMGVLWQYATRPQPPTTVSSPLLPQKDSSDPFDRYVRLSWSGIRPAYDSSSSDFGRIRGAIVQRATTPDGPWTTLATTTSWDQTFGGYDDRDFEIGRKYWYRIIVRAQNTNNNSAPSKATASIGSDLIDNYIAAPCGRGCTYNPRPRILFRAGYPSYSQGITIDPTMQRGDNPDWITPGYMDKGTTVIFQKKTDATDGAKTSSVYWETPGSGTGYFPIYYTKATAEWTDPVLTSRMPIKAAHINELRAAYDNVCDYYQTDRTAWGDTIVAGKTLVQRWPEHVKAIQQTAARIANRVNTWGSSDATLHIVLPTFKDTARPNAAAIMQLREILTML